MPPSDFFIDRSQFYAFDSTGDNTVDLFYDNAAFFSAIRAALLVATRPEDFVYFAGWWSDLDIPLGDPAAKPVPPTFRQVLTGLAAGRPAPDPKMSTARPPENLDGPQICCLLWEQKSQFSAELAAIKNLLGTSGIAGIGGAGAVLLGPTALPGAVLAGSIIGTPNLSAINLDTVTSINNLRTFSLNRGILDKAHRIFGSHHQKYIVVGSANGLSAFVGSSDFNADRLYTTGDTRAKNPPAGKGAPLNDVNVHLAGPAAADVLRSFVDRFKLHSDGTGLPLKGDGYPLVNPPANPGRVQVQISHTYGADYPFKSPVTTAAATHFKIISQARQYLYYEDQYLIGEFYDTSITASKLATALQAALSSNTELTVIGVLAPLAVVDDLWKLAERRSDFWQPLVNLYKDRVLLFEMLDPGGTDSGAGAYLHNKMVIADDAVASVGSVNFSRRSFSHDSEIMVTFGGSTPAGNAAREVRIARWMRHLGTTRKEVQAVSDGVALWRALWQASPAASSGRAVLARAWRPQPSAMTPFVRSTYRRFYDIIADPA